METLHPLMDSKLIDLFPLFKIFQGTIEVDAVPTGRSTMLRMKMKKLLSGGRDTFETMKKGKSLQ